MNSVPRKNIVIGITGGIAAYKSLFLIRLFKAHNYNVKVITTQSALQFVTPLTIETLSQNKLYCNLFEEHEVDVEHISLADWADAAVVAPATANIIGKLANGIADDALSTFLLAFDKKLFVAPAMNHKMYAHPAVRKNLQILQGRNTQIIEAQKGFLACGCEGTGRMEEPEQIFNIIHRTLTQKQIWEGVNVMVSAGPTYEPIDPVRFIGNHSSGLMGFALAQTLAEQGAKVTLVTGPTQLATPTPSIHRIDVKTAAEMFDACTQNAINKQLVIMAAAVADYTPTTIAPEKIKKTEENWSIAVTKTKDILFHLGQNKPQGQCLVGFALETENELKNAQKKLQNKNADFIVLNSMKDSGAGFNTPTNLVTILSPNGIVMNGELKSKKEVAADIVQTIYQHFFKSNK
jgi:phosphopantothenoylcysteine decarboxylase/phosphopantothenate--cysteine ligase